MKIELKRIPRYKDAPDERCIWHLIVNGHHIGTYNCGKVKNYEDKEKWAKTMIKKRNIAITRNLKRLWKETKLLQIEYEDLNN